MTNYKPISPFLRTESPRKMEKLHRSQLIAELKQSFPDLTEALNTESGLLCFELNAFCRFTMGKIDEGDQISVAQCYAIALKYYQNGTRKMRDAIDTCYVEDLEFPSPKKKDRAWAWEVFPEQLKILYNNFHAGR
jgi:hypothetical protein